MALHEISFLIEPQEGYESIPVDWAHNGVVGSGDMELLMQKTDSAAVQVNIVTPVAGYDAIWEKVLRKFVAEARLGGVSIEINDNNSTPYVVATRLKQGLLEAKAGERE
ncbi:malonate decarboxylase acyl carrier protein [Eubacteriales bacterium OttesenSCG-928-K08]|nr:malonate decarboxylase acyl carrier protein [Eubacteriales bacterium OttesenSCG-928-K08]